MFFKKDKFAKLNKKKTKALGVFQKTIDSLKAAQHEASSQRDAYNAEFNYLQSNADRLRKETDDKIVKIKDEMAAATENSDKMVAEINELDTIITNIKDVFAPKTVNTADVPPPPKGKKKGKNK